MVENSETKRPLLRAGFATSLRRAIEQRLGRLIGPARNPAERRRHVAFVAAAVLAGLVIVVLLAGTWHGLGGSTTQFVMAPVTRGTVARTVTATGTINPTLTIIVGTYVSGVVQEVRCDFNTKVTKGQLCAKIDQRPYQAVVDQASAQLAVAKSQLTKDQAALAYTKVNYERNATLVKTDSVSKDAFDLSKANYDQAQAQAELDKATIQQREAELSTAEVNLGYTNIVSPVDGTVVSRNVTIGQTVAASFQTPTLFLVATDLTKLEVDTNVSESDIGGVKEGAAASFTVESFPDKPFNGTVMQVRQAPQTVQNVVTYDVLVSVDNSGHSLFPGMTATTRIVVEQHENVLRVPSAALRFSPRGVGGAAIVRASDATGAATGPATGAIWVLRDGRPTRIDVRVGLDDDTNVALMDATLKEGDSVIVAEQVTVSRGVVQPRF